MWDADAFAGVSRVFGEDGDAYPLAGALLSSVDHPEARATTGTCSEEEYARFAEFAGPGPYPVLLALGVTEPEVVAAKAACVFSCGPRYEGRNGSVAVADLVEDGGFTPA